MDGAGRSPGALTVAAFSVAVVLGGGNFLAVRFSNQELPPFWGAGLRFGLTSVLFVLIALVLRAPWPRGRQLALTMLYGVMGFATFYALMYWALVRVPAGVATIVLAIVPLVTVVLAAVEGSEDLRGRNLAGALLALAGISWMVLGPQRVAIPLAALAAMLGAALSVGQSVIVGKRVAGNHPAVTNAIGMSTGTVLLLALSLAIGEQWALPQRREVITALVYLVLLGSGALFVLILLVVRRWTASATSYMFVLFPVATLALGAWLADEPVTVHAVAGAVLVMAGVWYGALSPGARRPAVPVPYASPAPR